MYDYHTHSYFSEDSSTPMNEIIEAAIRKGVREIAITDHYDPDYPDPDFPFEINFKRYHKELPEAVAAYKDRIKIIKGIEIGIQRGSTVIKCEEAANSFAYDFIIGSFHTAYGQALYLQYFVERPVKQGFYDFYSYVNEGVREYKNFDVLGHFNVVDRYVDNIPDYAPYMEIIEEILKHLIENGKGIEFNTSSFRYGLGERTTPSKEILSLYKALGGEIITIGSDAHKPRDVGYKYDEAVEILKSHGFKYITAYENRMPRFVKI